MQNITNGGDILNVKGCSCCQDSIPFQRYSHWRKSFRLQQLCISQCDQLEMLWGKA